MVRCILLLVALFVWAGNSAEAAVVWYKELRATGTPATLALFLALGYGLFVVTVVNAAKVWRIFYLWATDSLTATHHSILTLFGDKKGKK
jgi:uncharacterized integral membrane protein